MNGVRFWNGLRSAAVVVVLANLGCGGAGAESDPARLAASESAVTAGSCCADQDCLCHGDVVSEAAATRAGPFDVDTFTLRRGRGYGGGTIYFPTDAEPPFAAFVMCPGFTASGDAAHPCGHVGCCRSCAYRLTNINCRCGVLPHSDRSRDQRS
jgi:hypothetical protein